MLGGYPRLLTEARMTSKIVRCRSVSTESAGRALRSGPAPWVSLSLIWTNVAALSINIKHVFEACRRPLSRKSCRCRALTSAACATVRSHVRKSNTLSITIRTSDRPRAERRNAHDAHRDDLTEHADPLPAGPGASGRPPRSSGGPRPAAVEAGRCAPALPRNRSVDVDGVASPTSDYA